MPNLALTGVVPVEINHAFAITLTSFNVNVERPTTKKFGAFGVIGKAKGIRNVTGSFKLAVPTAGLEFDIDGLEHFSLTYTLGANKYVITGCDITGKNLSVEQQNGATELSCNFDGVEEAPI